jgi:hypothetical protein
MSKKHVQKQIKKIKERYNPNEYYHPGSYKSHWLDVIVPLTTLGDAHPLIFKHDAILTPASLTQSNMTKFKLAKDYLIGWLLYFRTETRYKPMAKYFSIDAWDEYFVYYFSVFNTITHGSFGHLIDALHDRKGGAKWYRGTYFKSKYIEAFYLKQDILQPHLKNIWWEYTHHFTFWKTTSKIFSVRTSASSKVKVNLDIHKCVFYVKIGPKMSKSPIKIVNAEELDINSGTIAGKVNYQACNKKILTISWSILFSWWNPTSNFTKEVGCCSQINFQFEKKQSIINRVGYNAVLRNKFIKEVDDAQTAKENNINKLARKREKKQAQKDEEFDNWASIDGEEDIDPGQQRDILSQDKMQVGLSDDSNVSMLCGNWIEVDENSLSDNSYGKQDMLVHDNINMFNSHSEMSDNITPEWDVDHSSDEVSEDMSSSKNSVNFEQIEATLSLVVGYLKPCNPVKIKELFRSLLFPKETEDWDDIFKTINKSVQRKRKWSNGTENMIDEEEKVSSSRRGGKTEETPDQEIRCSINKIPEIEETSQTKFDKLKMLNVAFEESMNL